MKCGTKLILHSAAPRKIHFSITAVLVQRDDSAFLSRSCRVVRIKDFVISVRPQLSSLLPKYQIQSTTNQTLILRTGRYLHLSNCMLIRTLYHLLATLSHGCTNYIVTNRGAQAPSLTISSCSILHKYLSFSFNKTIKHVLSTY